MFFFPDLTVSTVDCDSKNFCVWVIKALHPLDFEDLEGLDPPNPLPQWLSLRVLLTDFKSFADDVRILWVCPKLELRNQKHLEPLKRFFFLFQGVRNV